MDRPGQEWSWCKACKSSMKVQDVETHVNVCHNGDETAFIKGDFASSPYHPYETLYDWVICKICEARIKLRNAPRHMEKVHHGIGTVVSEDHSRESHINPLVLDTPKPTADELATESFTLAVAIKDSVDQWQKQILMNHMLDQKKRGKPVEEQLDTYKTLLPQ